MDVGDDGIQEMNIVDKFLKLFEVLKVYSKDEQKQKIEEMNGLIDEMSKDEFLTICSFEMFDKITKITKGKKIPLRNILLFPKHMGRLNAMKRLNVGHFKNSSLGKRIKNLIVEEEKKKEEKDEKILIDLCECYLLFYYEYDDLPKTMTNICVPPLLKVASNKDESKETQKEAETALLALGNVGDFIIPEELYLSEIKEIILYHQEHRHLTQIAYQSAWQFLIKRFVFDESLEGVIVNEMHFVREASKGLEKLMKHEDWKKKQKEAKKEKGIGKEPEEEHMMMKWLFAIGRYLTMCKLWNEESVLLVDSIVRLLRAARDINMDMSECCVNILYGTVMNRTMKIEGILKGWSFDAVLEEIQSQTLNRHLMKCLKFFLVISKRMKEKEKDEKEETKRKSTKKKVFVKMEEEGYEDIITSFHVVSRILKYRYDDSLSDYYADYFFEHLNEEHFSMPFAFSFFFSFLNNVLFIPKKVMRCQMIQSCMYFDWQTEKN